MIGYVVVFILGAALFVMLTAILFPRLFLKPVCTVRSTADRGIEKIKGDGFKGIVYMPGASVRRIVDRYMIEERDGKKYLVLSISGKIRYIDYGAIIFSVDGEVIDVVRIRDIPEERGVTAKALLPDQTAYISLFVYETDEGKEAAPPKFVIPKARMAVYCFFCAIAVLFESIIIKFSLANIFGGIFNESFMLSETFAITAAIMLCLIIFCIITLCMSVRRNTLK